MRNGKSLATNGRNYNRNPLIYPAIRDRTPASGGPGHPLTLSGSPCEMGVIPKVFSGFVHNHSVQQNE